MCESPGVFPLRGQHQTLSVRPEFLRSGEVSLASGICFRLCRGPAKLMLHFVETQDTAYHC